mgnify:CR=1 FL=1
MPAMKTTPLLLCLTLPLGLACSGGEPEQVALEGLDVLQAGDTVALIGGGLADRMQHDGWFETWLQLLQDELAEAETTDDEAVSAA